MADEMQKVVSFEWNSVLGGFGVAGYKSELKIHKLQMADEIQKVVSFEWNSVFGGIRGRWLQQIWSQNL